MIHDNVLILPQQQRPGQGAGQSPPDHLADFEIFAAAYLAGLRQAVILTTDQQAGDDAGLGAFNMLLRSRNLPEIRLRRVAPRSPAGRRAQDFLSETDAIRARRGFWRRGAAHLDSAEDPAPSTLARLQTKNADLATALFAVVPEIDADLCTGCDACIRVCPTQVLTQINETASQTVYHCAPAACNACGLCGDVCPASAIRLTFMNKSAGDISLINWECTACGVTVHVPAAQSTGGGLCSVCAQTGHHKKLHQVLS